jgi:hypothetical protein
MKRKFFFGKPKPESEVRNEEPSDDERAQKPRRGVFFPTSHGMHGYADGTIAEFKGNGE